VPNCPKQFPRRRIVRQLPQELLDRPKAGREVVAVIAIAEDGVELGQIRGVTVDGATNPDETRAKTLSGEWPLNAEWQRSDT
jgi:hypothetical protein